MAPNTLLRLTKLEYCILRHWPISEAALVWAVLFEALGPSHITLSGNREQRTALMSWYDTVVYEHFAICGLLAAGVQ